LSTEDGRGAARSRTLRRLPGEYAICRLDPHQPVPAWALGTATDFTSITRTGAELSIICPRAIVPDASIGDPGWYCLRVEGLFGLDEPGVLASVVSPLAAGGLSVFAVASHDTDHVLVRDPDVAVGLLGAAGHVVLSG
jgi:hypothetical protein